MLSLFALPSLPGGPPTTSQAMAALPGGPPTTSQAMAAAAPADVPCTGVPQQPGVLPRQACRKAQSPNLKSPNLTLACRESEVDIDGLLAAVPYLRFAADGGPLQAGPVVDFAFVTGTIVTLAARAAVAQARSRLMTLLLNVLQHSVNIRAHAQGGSGQAAAKARLRRACEAIRDTAAPGLNKALRQQQQQQQQQLLLLQQQQQQQQQN